MHRTTVEFEVVGSNVVDLLDQAEKVMSVVSGGGEWTVRATSPAEEDRVIEDYPLCLPNNRQIIRWRQFFKGTVEFD